MSNLLNVKEIQNKKLKSSTKKEINKVVYHINRKDDKTINTVLFKDIVSSFEKKYGVNNIMVRAVNNTGMMTFKSFAQNELDFIDFHEYYQNKVASEKNFEYFYSVEITILKK